jgi:hypothetical protein
MQTTQRNSHSLSGPLFIHIGSATRLKLNTRNYNGNQSAVQTTAEDHFMRNCEMMSMSETRHRPTEDLEG